MQLITTTHTHTHISGVKISVLTQEIIFFQINEFKIFNIINAGMGLQGCRVGHPIHNCCLCCAEFYTLPDYAPPSVGRFRSLCGGGVRIRGWLG